jgi:predicted Fe-S protein YdhL (DUF1289 family)
MPNQTIKTPCVGLCSTVYGDLVCRGCKRFHHEVIHWNGYNEDEKRAVWLRLEQLLSQVMAAKVEIFDPARCANAAGAAQDPLRAPSVGILLGVSVDCTGRAGDQQPGSLRDGAAAGVSRLEPAGAARCH